MDKGNESAKLDDLRYGRVFMLGIGGCSMSGLALLLKGRGYEVSGSSIIETEYTPKLREHGIEVFSCDDPELIKDASVIVYSHAVSMDNPVIVAAAQHGIPVRSRAWLLGQISDMYDKSVSICGTHGKTTVTSMLARILIESEKDPTVHIGGIFPPMGGNVRSGNSDLFITEACEYKRSFLSLNPTGVILMNIDEDHLDYYKDIDEIEQTFKAFVSKVPSGGWVLGYGDDPRVTRVLRSINCRVITFGISADCSYRLVNTIEDELGRYSFDICHEGRIIGHVNMGIPGLFNAINAAASIAAAMIIGVEADKACKIMETFRGVHRRFELTGTLNGAEIFHDYGHNPTEMRNAISIARKRCPTGKLWAVMQPKDYMRVKTLFDELLTCTADADITLVTDIYGNKRDDPGDINSGMLVDGMNAHDVNAMLTPKIDDAADVIRSKVQPGDLVITLGCGDIYLLNEILKETEESL